MFKKLFLCLCQQNKIGMFNARIFLSEFPDISRSELGDLLFPNVKSKAVSMCRLLKGDYQLRIEQFKKLADYVSMPMDELYTLCNGSFQTVVEKESSDPESDPSASTPEDDDLF